VKGITLHSWLAAPRASDVAATLERLAYLLMWGFVCTVPWAETVPKFGERVVTSWLGILAAALVCLRLLVGGKARRLAMPHWWMLALVGWSMLSLYWTLDWKSTVERVETYVKLLLAVWLIWEVSVDESRVLGLLRAWVLGMGLSAGITLYNFALGRTAADVLAAQGLHRWPEARFTLAGINENELSLMLGLSVPMSLYLIARTRGPIMLLYWIHLALCLTAIVLTGSRGGLIAAGCSLLMLLFVAPRLRRWQVGTAVGTGIAVAIIGIYLVPGATWTRLFELGTELSGTMTHRAEIWAAGIAIVRDHPLLGVGLGAFPAAVYEKLGRGYVAHNTFLSIAAELGVVGLAIFLVLLGSLLSAVVRMRHLERGLWMCVLLTWAVGVTALSWDYRKPTWIVFALIAAHVWSRRSAAPNEIP